MTTMQVLVVALSVISVLVVLTAGAVYEALGQVADIRRLLDMDDQPLSLVVPDHPVIASQSGLPGQIDREPEALVVFLSGKCATCLQIANTFRTGVPSFLWIVYRDGNHAGSEGFLATTLAPLNDRAIDDRDGHIASRAGINITPGVLSFRFGELTRAYGVSSVRQVLSLMPKEPTPMWLGDQAGAVVENGYSTPTAAVIT